MEAKRFNSFICDLEFSFAGIIDKFPETREHVIELNRLLSEKYSEITGRGIPSTSEEEENMETPIEIEIDGDKTDSEDEDIPVIEGDILIPKSKDKDKGKKNGKKDDKKDGKIKTRTRASGKSPAEKKNMLYFVKTMLLTHKKKSEEPIVLTEKLIYTDKESIVRGLTQLSSAIGTMKKKIVQYSNLQGKLILALKELTTPKKFTDLLSVVGVSKSYAYFLIRLHKLINMYPELAFCELPITFFRNNLSVIYRVCEDSPGIWMGKAVKGGILRPNRFL